MLFILLTRECVTVVRTLRNNNKRKKKQFAFPAQLHASHAITLLKPKRYHKQATHAFLSLPSCNSTICLRFYTLDPQRLIDYTEKAMQAYRVSPIDDSFMLVELREGKKKLLECARRKGDHRHDLTVKIGSKYPIAPTRILGKDEFR